MIFLPRVLAAAGDVQRFCQQQRWQFCFIGGVAVQRWGEPRLTQDVDLTILTGFEKEAQFIDALLSAFTPRRGTPASLRCVTECCSLELEVAWMWTRRSVRFHSRKGASSVHQRGPTGVDVDLTRMN